MENLFKDMELSSNVKNSIEKLGYTNPSEIQRQLIPVILNGDDALGQAQTGTGKTLAFAAGILSKINKEKEGVKAIVLSPTRELALQISREFTLLDQEKEFNMVEVYGGSDIQKQIKALRAKPDIVIGTPGRVKDLINRKKLNLTTIDFFVLDEADEMLAMGFVSEIEDILYNTARDKQVLMLSATMPKQIKSLVEKFMRNDFKHIVVKAESKTHDNITQSYYVVTQKLKLEVLCRVIDSKKINKSIIFVKTKRECDEISLELQKRGYETKVLHGDISQNIRTKTLEEFKHGGFKYLIATDVAARGIHVDNIDLVINYHIPFDKESYVHRIGRTGRASQKGEAVSLITSKEKDFIRKMEKFANCKITELGIPTKDEILDVKVKEILTEVENLVEKNDLDKEIEYVRDLNKGDLIKFSAALLKFNINQQIGAELHKELVIKERSVREVNSNKDRVFINIGRKDGLRKNKLIEFIEEATEISEENLSNIEILETFSFVDVNKEYTEKLISNMIGEKYNTRNVNAEISGKKAKEHRRKRSDHRHGSSGRNNQRRSGHRRGNRR